MSVDPTPIRTQQDGHPIVRVAYRRHQQPAPTVDPTDLTAGYAYAWPLDQPPQIGDRVILEQAGGDTGVVIGLHTRYPDELLTVHAIAKQSRRGSR
ncbi:MULTISPECIES: hypothetical protein [unclassified Microbacterium]|uniref:hypothetical protein n=1 Tax=unclassified Microbacterium TaxID=2609290 RepID=UPI003C30C135